jgi:sterol desaturase/sphingolipid hydroxylase (fatty acid hydroxylase superfamily)
VESEFSSNIFAHLHWVNEPSARIYWLYLASAMIIALLAYQRISSGKFSALRFFQYLLPPSIYLHRSAKVDYLFFLVNGVIFWGVVGPVMAFSGTLGQYFGSGLRATFGEFGFTPLSIPLLTALYTVATVIAMDLALFAQHWLMHRVPWLWEFHKVHHSAEVLTPMTVYRMHPVDDLLAWSLTGLAGGVTIGIFHWLYPLGLPIYTYMGINVVVFLFYFFGYNLRHSHIWVSYGPVVSHVLVSPAQHQIHHSAEERHWDKNFGFIFALWDWLAGTLYVPREHETFRLGIGGEERHFSSVRALYLRPFQNLLRSRKSEGKDSAGDGQR